MSGRTEFPRDEFVRAFAGHLLVPPGTERVVARPAGIALVTVLVLLLVGISGALWGIFHPKPAPGAPAAGKAGTTTFTAVAGWDCDAGTDRGFEATGRTPKWRTSARGGWPGDGCHGTFEAVPFSGRTDAETPAFGAFFWFAPKDVRRCTVEVWVPKAPKRADAAATAARFLVQAGENGAAYASFTVDQTAAPGTWVRGGEFPVSGGRLVVKLVDRGKPAGSEDRLAVTQVRVACTS